MYIGIDIGGTKCAVVRADENGRITKKIKFVTADKDETLTAICDAAREMGPAVSIGISCGGPLDTRAGVILSPPNLPGWDRVPIVSMLEEKLGIKAYLQNDANACALAEWKFGAGEMCENMVFLTFGTGMGAGLILNGRIYEGASGNAGEIGHVRMASHGPVGFGKAGSFEGFCSGGGIKQLGRAKALALLQMGKTPSFCASYADLDGISAKTIAECADKGCADALEVYCTCGEYLGRGLSVLVDVLNPDRIVIGSIYARREALLADTVQDVLRRECIPSSLAACSVVPAALGEEIGDYAAISVAMTGGK